MRSARLACSRRGSDSEKAVAELPDVQRADPRRQRLCGVEQQRRAGLRRERLEALDVADAHEGVRADDRARAVGRAAQEAAVRHQLPGSTSTKRGSRPFHSSACSVEANVNDGTSTGVPGSRPSARTASVSPMSQLEVARTCRSPV